MGIMKYEDLDEQQNRTPEDQSAMVVFNRFVMDIEAEMIWNVYGLSALKGQSSDPEETDLEKNHLSYRIFTSLAPGDFPKIIIQLKQKGIVIQTYSLDLYGSIEYKAFKGWFDKIWAKIKTYYIRGDATRALLAKTRKGE